MRQILLYPGQDGFWLAECPTLKGCISQGKTKAEAIENIKEAIDLYIDCLIEDGKTYFEALKNAEVIISEWLETAKELGRKIPEPMGKLVF